MRRVTDPWCWVSNVSYNFLSSGPTYSQQLGQFSGERVESEFAEKIFHILQSQNLPY